MGNSQSEGLEKNLNSKQLQAWKNLQIKNQRLKEENSALKEKNDELLNQNVLANLVLSGKELKLKRLEGNIETDDKSCNTDDAANEITSDPYCLIGSLSPTPTDDAINNEFTKVQELLDSKDGEIASLQSSLKQLTLEFEQHKKKMDRLKSDNKINSSKLKMQIKDKNKKISEQANLLSAVEHDHQRLDGLKRELILERKISKSRLISCQDLQIEYNEILAVTQEQVVEIKRMKDEVENLNTRLTNECLISGSSQAHVAQLKQKIAEKNESFHKETSTKHLGIKEYESHDLNQKDEKIKSLEKSLKESSVILQEYKQYIRNTENVLSEQKTLVGKLNAEITQKSQQIIWQANQISSLDKLNESKLYEYEKQLHELRKTMEYENKISVCRQVDMQNLETRLVNECLVSGSRQAHVEQLKQQIAALTETSKTSSSKFSSQLSKKSSEIAALKKEVEAKRKKIESLTTGQVSLQNANTKLKTKSKNLKAAHHQEVKKHEARLEMALNTGEVDVVSVHLVAEIYKMYKEKSDLLENATKSQTSSTSTPISSESSQAVEEPSSLESKQETQNSGATVSDSDLWFLTKILQKSPRSFDCSSCGKSVRINNRVVFYPCCHGACQSCASKLKLCYLCQTPIQSKEKQFT